MTRAVVTGATGFVGRALLPVLNERGCEILALARDDAQRGPVHVVDRVVSFRPEVVIHLATHFLATHEVSEIPELVRANVEWGTVVAEAATQAGARLVTIGSAWQHHQGRDYDPVSLYAATKQALDDIVEYYARVRGLVRCGVTLFDTYGPGDPRPKLVPALLQASLTGVPLRMSDGAQLIDLTFIDDVAAAIAHVALSTEPDPSCVVRSWHPLTVRDLVQLTESAIGHDIPVEWGGRPAREREMREDWVFGHAPSGWAPTVSLDDGIRRTWAAMRGDHG